ncbi:MAG: metal-dependent hydrolase [Desulfuromonas sp.]|nr:MAG: metal-dependent hydrolase [Desulfuromonas sp.]
MHCHVAGIGAGGSGAFISDELRDSWKFGIYLKAFGVTEEELLQHGDALVVQRISEQLEQSQQVGRAVLLALDGVIDANGDLDRERTETYIPNEFLAAEVARYSNLYFGASVNPYRHDALARLEQAKADGAVLIKWLPAIQHIDPADPRLTPFYDKLVELDLPLLTHAGDEHSFTMADNSLGDPQKLHLALQRGVTVIVAHAATSGTTVGEDNMERLLPMFAQYPNLYTDISSLTQVNKLRFLPRLLAAGVDPQHLLYGTDFPLITTGLTSPVFSSLRLHPGCTLELIKAENPWDQDVQTKLAHGVDPAIFANAHTLLIK